MRNKKKRKGKKWLPLGAEECMEERWMGIHGCKNREGSGSCTVSCKILDNLGFHQWLSLPLWNPSSCFPSGIRQNFSQKKREKKDESSRRKKTREVFGRIKGASLWPWGWFFGRKKEATVEWDDFFFPRERKREGNGCLVKKVI
jgi:hypothetical protein